MHNSFRTGFEKSANVAAMAYNNPRIAGTLMHALPGAMAGAAGGALGGAALSDDENRVSGTATGALAGGIAGGLVGGYRGYHRGERIGDAIKSHYGEGAKVIDARSREGGPGVYHAFGTDRMGHEAAGTLGAAAVGAAGGTAANRFIKEYQRRGEAANRE